MKNVIIGVLILIVLAGGSFYFFDKTLENEKKEEYAVAVQNAPSSKELYEWSYRTSEYNAKIQFNKSESSVVKTHIRGQQDGVALDGVMILITDNKEQVLRFDMSGENQYCHYGYCFSDVVLSHSGAHHEWKYLGLITASDIDGSNFKKHHVYKTIVNGVTVYAEADLAVHTEVGEELSEVLDSFLLYVTPVIQ